MEPDVVEVGRIGPGWPRWPCALLAIGALTVGVFVVARRHPPAAHPAAVISSAVLSSVTAAPVIPTSPVNVYDVGL